MVYEGTESKLLCGVDPINGRRRITSRLVEGARVLAKWSDEQPLVVQHPGKNVLSISQRVSRIFELDDDLGHDDTLQLVLNAMLYAGKEARRMRGRHIVFTNGAMDAGASNGTTIGNSSADNLHGMGPSFMASAGGVNVSL